MKTSQTDNLDDYASNSQNQLRLISLKDAAAQTALGQSTLLAWEKQGRFPKALRLGRMKRVWLQRDINDWILEKIDKTLVPKIGAGGGE